MNKNNTNPEQSTAKRLWSDLVTDNDRLSFLESGRAVETGIIAPVLVPDIIDLVKYRMDNKLIQSNNSVIERAKDRSNKLTWRERIRGSIE